MAIHDRRDRHASCVELTSAASSADALADSSAREASLCASSSSVADAAAREASATASSSAATRDACSSTRDACSVRSDACSACSGACSASSSAFAAATADATADATAPSEAAAASSAALASAASWLTTFYFCRTFFLPRRVAVAILQYYRQLDTPTLLPPPVHVLSIPRLRIVFKLPGQTNEALCQLRPILPGPPRHLFSRGIARHTPSCHTPEADREDGSSKTSPRRPYAEDHAQTAAVHAAQQQWKWQY